MKNGLQQQISFFDVAETARPSCEICRSAETIPDEKIAEKFVNYSLQDYVTDVEINGLADTWGGICRYIAKFGEGKGCLNIAGFGEMYEQGLAICNKHQKKKNGQYYTPEDVACLMSQWLEECDGDNVCDVACGTGNLILAYLRQIGDERAKELIRSGRVYLFDSDPVALQICKTSICVRYEVDNPDVIHDIGGDFLSRAISLPPHAKVISNPPYAAIEEIRDSWNRSTVLTETNEMYAAFMEKIFTQSEAAVVISPFSFVSGNKFFSLRKQMCKSGNGFIVSFDNIPGNIFCGKKQGVFNTNMANSVRAAITTFRRDDKIKGFRVSPLIRFKREERAKILSRTVLMGTLPEKLQIVDEKNRMFGKIDKNLLPVYEKWRSKSNCQFVQLLSDTPTDYYIDMPNTCRYYTTASHHKLSRSGSLKLYAKDKETFNVLYCLINSSFAYWWWRIYDGGITYPSGLLGMMPVPINLLSEEDKAFFGEMSRKMIDEETRYITVKVNAGATQENVKFPKQYRDCINGRFLSILEADQSPAAFDPVHANGFFTADS